MKEQVLTKNGCMNKRIKSVLIIILLAFFISCKKDKTNTTRPENTISADIDGNARTFNYGAKATKLMVSGGYGVTITGNKANPSSSKTAISFEIASPSVISNGSYIENTVGNPLVTMNYDFDLLLGIVYTSVAHGSVAHPATIIITEIDAAHIKGTFSGELSGTDVNGNPWVTLITNGMFNVQF